MMKVAAWNTCIYIKYIRTVYKKTIGVLVDLARLDLQRC